MMEQLASAEGQAFLAVGGVALAKVLLMYYASRQKQMHTPQAVGTVSRLKIYPIKSGNGVDVSTLHCDHDGLRCQGIGDRQWVVVDGKGTIVTVRKEGTMLHLNLSLHDDGVHVDGEGMSTLVLSTSAQKRDTESQTSITSIYSHSIPGVDCGDEAATWINKYLRRPPNTYRLISCPDWLPKSRVVDGPTKQHKRAEAEDLCLFQNMCATTLLNEASMADLAARVSVPVSEANFRANILIEGAPAFDEDEYSEVHIGKVVFIKLKDTDRCPSTTVDPGTGKFNPNQEPLKTLRSYRMLPGYRSPCFCISLLIRKPGHIKVGDEVKVIRK